MGHLQNQSIINQSGSSLFRFNHSTRINLKKIEVGNNRAGRVGKLVCTACRVRKSKVIDLSRTFDFSARLSQKTRPAPSVKLERDPHSV
jgi:hypothetical protein